MQRAPARRGVLGGAVLIAVGVPFLLQAVGTPNASAYLFLALGLAFGAAWYIGSRQYVYLVPAAALITFGLGLIIPSLFALSSDLAAPIFLGALAIGFFVVFVASPPARALVPAVCSGSSSAHANGAAILPQFQPMFVPRCHRARRVLLVKKGTVAPTTSERHEDREESSHCGNHTASTISRTAADEAGSSRRWSTQPWRVGGGSERAPDDRGCRRKGLKPGGRRRANSGNRCGSGDRSGDQGLPLVCTMADKQRQEKRDLLRAFGAEVVVSRPGAAECRSR